MKKAFPAFPVLASVLIFSSFAIIRGAQSDRIGKVDCKDPKFRPMWESAMRRYPLPATAEEMRFVTSFPDEKLVEKDIYVGRPMGLARSADGRMYVLDQKLRQVLQFDASGTYVRTFGRKGQGPGEFSIPVAICASKESIYVVDNGNRSIMRFSLSGEFLGSKKTLYSYVDIAVGPGGELYAVALSIMKKDGLVDVLSREGEYLETIAKPKEDPSIDELFLRFLWIAVNDEGEILLAGREYPRVIKYDRSGNWLDGWAIDNMMMKEAAQSNLRNMIERKIKPSLPSHSAPVIEGFAASPGGGFYLLRNFPRTEILEYDGRGRLMKDHWCLPACDYRAKNLAIDPDTGWCYTIQWMPEDRIDVFSMRR
jgi:hypothetical protein